MSHTYADTLALIESMGQPSPPYLAAGDLVTQWNQPAGQPVTVSKTSGVFVCTRCWALVPLAALILHDETHPAPREIGPIEKCRECGREEWGHSWLDHMK